MCDVEWLLLSLNQVVAVVEIEAVLAFLGHQANHHMELGGGGRQREKEASVWGEEEPEGTHRHLNVTSSGKPSPVL